jgi:hypothetical protein
LVSNFFHTFKVGAKLVCSQRALVWLLPAYTLPLLVHRYLENTVNALYAKNVLNNNDLQSILTGGSNLGELAGAAAVLLFARTIRTPIPFLRADAIAGLLIWALPYWPIGEDTYLSAWTLTPIMAVISFGWASGDVSLAAYIQSRLHDYEDIDEQTSPLAAVMSFLYVTYLLGYQVSNVAMGAAFSELRKNMDVKVAFLYIGGVFMTVCGVITFISTFIPRGAFAWNPVPDQLYFEEIAVQDKQGNRISRQKTTESNVGEPVKSKV